MPNWHADEALDFSWHTCSTFSVFFANTPVQEGVSVARCELQFDVSHKEYKCFACLATAF